MTTFKTKMRPAPVDPDVSPPPAPGTHAATRAVSTLAELGVCGPSIVDICLVQGDTKLVRLTFTDALDAPVDVSAWTFLSQIRDDYVDDAPVLVEFLVSIVPGGDSNVVELILTAVETEGLVRTESNLYRWDVKATDGAVTDTLVAGDVSVVGTSSSSTK